MNRFTTIILLVFSLSSLKVSAQSLPVGTPVLEDAYRRAQLLGKLDSSASFTARPFFPSLSGETMYSYDSAGLSLKGTGTNEGKKKKLVVLLLPVNWKQQYTSDHPEGLNDGAMIPARGYQTMLSGGFYAQYGWLSIQLRPELVVAENKAYQGFPDEHPDAVWRSYYHLVLNTIDLPERFGEKAYQKAFWGQSSIRLTKGSLSIGLSNENLWWGPGMQNALLMTNSAPGFKHLTLNTVKPLRTPIGSFEGQLVAGRLDASGYPNIDPGRLLAHKITYTAKSDDWRYLNGIVLSFQPKWIPGLFLGATRSFSIYSKDLGNGITDYLPVIIPVTKKSTGDKLEDTQGRNQLASVFMRWVSPEAHQEIYLEYGREDHSYDLTDLMLEPGHAGAYLLGFRKLIPIPRHPDEFIDVQVELTQQEKSVTTLNRAGGNSLWYHHWHVKDGYTHNGQYLGAGIGTGSNMQSLGLSWVKDLKRLGIELKRVVHDNDFWAYAIKDYRSHWVDFGGSVMGEWNYKNLLLNARIETLSSINYQWLYQPIPSDPPYWWDWGKNRVNVRAEVGVSYWF